jgi:hypothetical protein
MPQPPRSVAALERDLRKLMRSPKLRIEERELNGPVMAWVDYDNGEILIVVDAFRGGHIESTVHELIHACYARKLYGWGGFEETFVVAMEQELMARINTDRARVRWWRRAISEHLKGEAA